MIHPVETARTALLAELDALDRAVRDLTGTELLRPSRCDGWAVRDLLAHVHIGLQELLVILASPTDAGPQVDAVSYWSQRTAGGTGPAPDADAGAHARFVSALASAYAAPSGLVAHLRHTGEAVRHAVGAADPAQNRVQEGRAMTTGDVFGTWTVEFVVHHLDATVAPLVEPPAPRAYAVARATLDALLGQAPPARWDDATYVLTAAGRVPLSGGDRVELGVAARRFPLLG